MSFGLTDQAIALITTVLSQYPAIEKATIFGSRAMGNYQPNSDIDLVLYGNVEFSPRNSIASTLDDLPLPYLFDVLVYNDITSDALREHIDRYGKELYNR